MAEYCKKCSTQLGEEDYVFMGYCEKCYQNLSDEELMAIGVDERIIEKENSTSNLKLKNIYYEDMKNTENMILTTTNVIEGYNISEYIGIVAGTDIYLVGGLLGGGLANQENLYATALYKATNNLKANAQSIGANGIIGIQCNVSSPGDINYIIVTLTGTAVKVDKK